MDDSDIPDPPPEANLKNTTTAVKRAWQLTVEEMEALAEDRREDGWEVTTVQADHTDPVTKDMGEDDRFGLFHVVSKSDGEAFVEAYDEDAFTEYLVYGSGVEGRRFAVTELLDPDGERSIPIAYEFPFERARGLDQNAREADAMYTYVRKIDGTILGSYEHEVYEPMLVRPEPDAEE